MSLNLQACLIIEWNNICPKYFKGHATYLNRLLSEWTISPKKSTIVKVRTSSTFLQQNWQLHDRQQSIFRTVRILNCELILEIQYMYRQ